MHGPAFEFDFVTNHIDSALPKFGIVTCTILSWKADSSMPSKPFHVHLVQNYIGGV